jgi:hypothetical protein
VRASDSVCDGGVGGGWVLLVGCGWLCRGEEGRRGVSCLLWSGAVLCLPVCLAPHNTNYQGQNPTQLNQPTPKTAKQEKLDPEETLVIVVSKSFTTAETMLNARTMRQWLWDTMGTGPEVAAKHMAACASASAAPLVLEFGIPHDRLFEFWDWVGGRYSVCASPGALPISLKFGFGVFEKFLVRACGREFVCFFGWDPTVTQHTQRHPPKPHTLFPNQAGARAMDRHFLSAPLDQNLPVLMGLLGVWNISFLGYKCRTIIPYAEALMKFPAHIQQVGEGVGGIGGLACLFVYAGVWRGWVRGETPAHADSPLTTTTTTLNQRTQPTNQPPPPPPQLDHH